MTEAGIIVEASAPVIVEVYEVSGCIAATLECAAGETLIPVAKGLYIVKAGTMTSKVMVSGSR